MHGCGAGDGAAAAVGRASKLRRREAAAYGAGAKTDPRRQGRVRQMNRFSFSFARDRSR